MVALVENKQSDLAPVEVAFAKNKKHAEMISSGTQQIINTYRAKKYSLKLTSRVLKARL